MSLVLTPDQEAEFKQAAIENRLPDPQVMGFGGAPSPPKPNGSAPPVAEDADIFSEADLTGEELDACAPYVMPNGKRVYVFPVSGAEARMISFQAAKAMPDYEVGDSETDRVMKQQAFEIDLWSLYVIAACRKGKSLKAPRCFSYDAREKILKYLSVDVLKEIAALSGQLGAGRLQRDREALAAFFADTQALWNDWLSASSTWESRPPDLVERTNAMMSRLPSMRQPESGLSAAVAT